jgi:hypothetical protein
LFRGMKEVRNSTPAALVLVHTDATS